MAHDKKKMKKIKLGDAGTIDRFSNRQKKRGAITASSMWLSYFYVAERLLSYFSLAELLLSYFSLAELLLSYFSLA